MRITQTVIGDSSSLIYLSKVDLLASYTQIVRLIVSPHVYEECTRHQNSEDARQIRRLIQEKNITVCQIPETNHLPLSHLGEGEKSAIELYYVLKADSIIIDDRKGIQVCKKHRIPFLCAILVPALLLQNHLLNDQAETDQFIEKICQIGRYNQWIINYAKKKGDRA